VRGEEENLIIRIKALINVLLIPGLLTFKHVYWCS